MAQPDVSCLWDNGSTPPRAPEFDGELSHLGGGMPVGAMAADDFFLCEGEVHRLTVISVELATNAVPGLEKAKVQIYSDCNGGPDKLLYKLTQFRTEFIRDLPDGYRLLRFTFVVEEQDDPAVRNLILRGGSFWLVAVGLTDNQPTNLTFWGATESPVRGRPAMKIIGTGTGATWDDFVFPGPWSLISECCLGCVDLAFRIDGESCKVLYNSGEADLTVAPGGIASEISESTRDSRAAGDFVIPTCTTQRICYIESCVFTNCEEFVGLAEVYPNACKVPGALPGAALHSVKATKVVDLGRTINHSGRTLRAYRLVFDLSDDQAFELEGGSYWLSVGVMDTFSAEERALMCYSARCGTTCQVDFNTAASIEMIPPVGSPSHPTGPTTLGVWQAHGSRDVSFLIAGRELQNRSGSGASTTPPDAGCAADIDDDGRATVDDLFAYLDAFFAGCP